MAAKKSLLEQLIDVAPEATSAERRDILRQISNTLLAAPDRYNCREMEHFDLLFAQAGHAIEHKIARVLAMALTKSGAPKNLVRKLLLMPKSILGPLLKKSVSLSLPALINLIHHQNAQQFDGEPAATIDPAHLAPKNRYTLPRPFLDALFDYVYSAKRHDLAHSVNSKLLPVLDRTIERFKEQIIIDSTTIACNHLMEARKTIIQKSKANEINEEYLLETLHTQQYTEFHFALSQMMETDISTTQCMLMDSTFESFAIGCRSANISRVAFSKFINHFQSNNAGQSYGLRIIGLYNKLEKDASDRVMRFWQLQVKSMKQEQSTLAQQAVAPPPFAADTPQNRKKSFGRG